METYKRKKILMDIFKDKRVVLTLDAGGTNFVFGAMQEGKEMITPMTFPSNANNLDKCLYTIINGFEAIIDEIRESPVAISFAFPGPADYSRGIIGDLANLPAFRGGVALASMLEEKFGIPVFIQNDGDLYAYGEAIGGILPEINSEFERLGSQKRYKNLLGLTLGTGFGAGIVHDGNLISGDNNMPAEIWNISNSISPWQNAEEGLSTRAIVNTYFEKSGLPKKELMPRDVFQIAREEKDGNADAARDSFHQFGAHLGDAIANMMMLFDGIVVMGGGLTGAKELYMPAVMEVLNGKFKNGQERLVHEVFSLDDKSDYQTFFTSCEQIIKVPFSEKKLVYDPLAKVAVATTKLGASKAIAIGAYAYALTKLN